MEQPVITVCNYVDVLSPIHTKHDNDKDIVLKIVLSIKE